MEINPELLFLIVGWLVGLFSGFFAIMSFDIWKRRQERRQLKDLIRQELMEIRSELDLHLKSSEGDEIDPKGSRTSVFDQLRGDILRKLNVKISRQIEIVYAEINSLGGNRLRKKHEEVLRSIDNLRKNLNDS
jgi:hypothetical protein